MYLKRKLPLLSLIFKMYCSLESVFVREGGVIETLEIYQTKFNNCIQSFVIHRIKFIINNFLE